MPIFCACQVFFYLTKLGLSGEKHLTGAGLSNNQAKATLITNHLTLIIT